MHILIYFGTLLIHTGSQFKELSQYLRRRTGALHKLVSWRQKSKQRQIPRSPVQTTVCKYKLLRCVKTQPRSGRRPRLKKLVSIFRNSSITTKAQACRGNWKLLEHQRPGVISLWTERVPAPASFWLCQALGIKFVPSQISGSICCQAIRYFSGLTTNF